MQTTKKHPGGRPRCTVDRDQVLELRKKGLSWRGIARTLRIGTATAIRLYNALPQARDASQNSSQGVRA